MMVRCRYLNDFLNRASAMRMDTKTKSIILDWLYDSHKLVLAYDLCNLLCKVIAKRIKHDVVKV